MAQGLGLGSLLVFHHLLDLADARGRGAPDLLLKPGLTLLDQGLDRLAPLKGLPELTLQLRPLNEVEALEPLGTDGHGETKAPLS